MLCDVENISWLEILRYHSERRYGVFQQPLNAYYFFTYGKLYSSLGRHAEAVNALQRAIKIKPDSFEAHNTLGSLCNMLGRYGEAVDAYK